MSGNYIFRIEITDEATLDKLVNQDCPVGYIVVSETEVKARNFIRRHTSLQSESEAYKKSAKVTSSKALGAAFDNVNPGVLAPIFED